MEPDGYKKIRYEYARVDVGGCVSCDVSDCGYVISAVCMRSALQFASYDIA